MMAEGSRKPTGAKEEPDGFDIISAFQFTKGRHRDRDKQRQLALLVKQLQEQKTTKSSCKQVISKHQSLTCVFCADQIRQKRILKHKETKEKQNFFTVGTVGTESDDLGAATLTFESQAFDFEHKNSKIIPNFNRFSQDRRLVNAEMRNEHINSARLNR